MTKLSFIKIGGSVITDKSVPFSLNEVTIKSVANQVKNIYAAHPNEAILLGTGAGSFGHFLAHELPHTKNGLYKSEDAIKIHHSVELLNSQVTKALSAENVPVISLPAAAFAHFDDDKLVVATDRIYALLASGIVVSVYGDMVPADANLWRVLSTEPMMLGLAEQLCQHFSLNRCILASNVDGVLDNTGHTIKRITKAGKIANHKQSGYDVSGGMAQKLTYAQKLADHFRSVMILNGNHPDILRKSFTEDTHGTFIEGLDK